MVKPKVSHRPFSKIDKKLSVSPRENPPKHEATSEVEAEGSSPARFSDLAREEGITLLDVGPGRVAPPVQPERHAVAASSSSAMPGGLSEHRFEIDDQDGWLEGRRSDVPPVALRGLRQRLYRKRLDLHGFTAAEARSEMHRFLATCHGSDDEVVLVIVGKGKHRASGRGVLRDSIGRWLTELPSASWVRAFVTAPRHHGGDGAILVLLSK